MHFAQIIFAFTALSEALLGLALAATLIRPALRIWPPPGQKSWQYRYVWTLTGLSTAGVVLVGITDWNTFVFGHCLRLPLGILLILAGNALALWGVHTLSLHATLGLEGKLIDSGPYRFTRNPQYTGDIALLIGFAILCNSGRTWIVCWLGIVWFALAPFTEEPWLRELYGESYERYAGQVGRFFTLPRRKEPPGR